jgi:hypothetical protein
MIIDLGFTNPNPEGVSEVLRNMSSLRDLKIREQNFL